MKVAIVQNSIIYGGRLAVIVKIIELLNKRDILPDLLTYKTTISSDGIRERYGVDIFFRIKKIESFFSKIPNEANIVSFGLSLRKLYKKYNYFIEINNTSFLMPSQIPIFSYVQFPRIARMKSKYMCIHHPEGPQKKWTDKKGAFLKMIGFLYSFHSINENNYIVSNSEFSRSYFQKFYSSYRKYIPVIYPPVDTGQSFKKSFRSRGNDVSSLGRFCEAKNQLEQINVAKKIPQWNFHLIGFAEKNNPYLKYCREYVERNNIRNVFFHANVSANKKKELLSNSKFFVHTNINEPFGISTVEAIVLGCIPLVHNSGGQKEIVPFDHLRFNRIEDLCGFFKNFRNSGGYYDVLGQKLIEHCKNNFSSEIFVQKFNDCLNYFEKQYV